MDKLTDILTTLIWVCGALVVLTVISLLVYKGKMKATAQKLLGSNQRGGELIVKLLKTAFHSSRIITHAVLPLENGQKAMADIILVDRGGIFVIRVKTFPGSVDNSSRSSWAVTNHKGVGEFPNPFEQNKYAVQAIDELMKKEELYNVPKHNVVVFSQKRVTFKIRSEKLLTAERMIEALKDLNRNRFLNGKEISLTLAAIRKYNEKSANQ